MQGEQGKLVCRYLFMRSENEPAPWTTDGERSVSHTATQPAVTSALTALAVLADLSQPWWCVQTQETGPGRGRCQLMPWLT